ncbi:GntR family transcriptional regulator [Aeromicrobium sp. CF4.19]|uniref:GntR family transcriptional regulator n=1 Tax=Aeromicrobium sp. CF4.19 TaxID=3373082 RepID=UPI003EE605C9
MTVRVSATDRVFAVLRDAILSGRMEAGSRHSIYRLAEQHGVSRTPVRDAVLRLADVGLVTIERNRGVVVRAVTPDDVREVFELRLLLEVPAAVHAARHLDDDLAARLRDDLAGLRAAARSGDVEAFDRHDRALHAAVDGALGNARLVAQVAAWRESIQARGAVTVNRSRDLDDILGEHVPVVESILSQDPAAAAAAMREHLVSTASLLIEQTGGDPSSMLLWQESARAEESS